MIKKFQQTILLHFKLNKKDVDGSRESFDDLESRQRGFSTVPPRRKQFRWWHEKPGFPRQQNVILWSRFHITPWRKPPYRITLSPQTHNVTWLWCREVHKCSQVQQRVCIRYVYFMPCTLYTCLCRVHLPPYRYMLQGIVDNNVFSQFSWLA